MEEAIDLERITSWVSQHDFQRIAVQLPDDLLPTAFALVTKLQKDLPGRKLFLLGDSFISSSSVDEVGAHHYGADCIVHVGSSDQEHAGELPVLFVFSRAGVREAPFQAVASALGEHFSTGRATLVLVAEVAWQHMVRELPTDLVDVVRGAGNIHVAEPQLEATVNLPGWNFRMRDWRFGSVSLGCWWTALGPLCMAASALPEPLRVCGREVRTAGGSTPLRRLAPNSAFLYLGEPGSALERRLLLRHGASHPVWRLDPTTGDVAQITSNALLMRRYRFVELVKSAGTVGLLLCATGASYGSGLADRLETLLQRSGRKVYRFVVGRVTPEKLGNFPDIDCFVSLASPDHFPFDTKDFHVPIASPYEVEVALGVREWIGEYVIDLDELLQSPLPGRGPTEEMLQVQTLGAKSRLHSFQSGAETRLTASKFAYQPGLEVEERAPALAIPGLHGVAGRYSTEG